MFDHFARLIAALALCASLSLSAAPGDLDPSFGSGTGVVITPISSRNERALAVAVQADGKIVLGGYCNANSRNNFCLVRYLPTGALDPAFNTNGKLITQIGPGASVAAALIVQPDGKLLLGGQCTTASFYFCIARYMPDGAFDTTFNGTGSVVTVLGSITSGFTSIALQPDGKIVGVGGCKNGTATLAFCLIRYDSNGALDPLFNSSGTVITPIGSSDAIASGIALQADGKLVTAGTCGTAICVTRHLAGGGPDPSFNGSGLVIAATGVNSANATAVTLQPDGKILVTGTCAPSGLVETCLLRFLPNGEVDTTFNGSGRAASTSTNYASALTLQPDGKIVLAVECSDGDASFCFVRYFANGTADNSVKGTGAAGAQIEGGSARAVALQSDGKIVVAGFSTNAGGASPETDFSLARFDSGRFDAGSCTMDIDGDGATSATIDGLIISRVMLGLRGPPVVNGISFPAGASRTTWTAVRDYLVGLCGMTITP
jgi:uncharacterized delta-60 repeat protein